MHIVIMSITENRKIEKLKNWTEPNKKKSKICEKYVEHSLDSRDAWWAAVMDALCSILGIAGFKVS